MIGKDRGERRASESHVEKDTSHSSSYTQQTSFSLKGSIARLRTSVRAGSPMSESPPPHSSLLVEVQQFNGLPPSAADGLAERTKLW